MKLDYCQLLWLKLTVDEYLEVYRRYQKDAKGNDVAYFEHLVDRIQDIADEVNCDLVVEKRRKMEEGTLNESTHAVLTKWGGYCQGEDNKWLGES